MRVWVLSIMGSSPGNIVFNRDMFLNIPLIADWHAITLNHKHLINKNLMKENQKWRRYDNAPQQRILKKTWKPRKLGLRTTGPYTLLRSHVNGGPEGRSLYCLNLNCRAPPGRLLQPDLSFQWAILYPSSYIDSTRFGLFRMPHHARVLFST